jgi:hypothetical protein
MMADIEIGDIERLEGPFQDAIQRAANDDRCTWVTSSGSRIAAIVPAAVAVVLEGGSAEAAHQHRSHELMMSAAAVPPDQPARIIDYRDIRPDGNVLTTWQCVEGREFGSDYGQYGPGEYPSPPWERQRREPGGEWETVATVVDGQTLLQPGVVMSE